MTLAEDEADISYLLADDLVSDKEPRFTSSIKFDGVVGSPVSFALTTNQADVSWEADYLPAGLILNPATGVISGTVAESGVFWPCITVTNSDGYYQKKILWIKIKDNHDFI